MEKIITLEQAMNNKNFDNEFNYIIINGYKPISFIKEDYEIIEGIPKYTDANKYGRSGVATAIISRNTLAIYTSQNIVYPKPINWSKTIQDAGFYNKSHIIGYSLSAKKEDTNNIFIGTKYLNKITMKNIENNLYYDIKKNNRIYLYKVTPMYKFKEDIVPLGVLLETETIDKYEKKQICKFCYNIQNGKKINYYDGSNKPIEKVYGRREPIKEIKNRKQRNE